MQLPISNKIENRITVQRVNVSKRIRSFFISLIRRLMVDTPGVDFYQDILVGYLMHSVSMIENPFLYPIHRLFSICSSWRNPFTNRNLVLRERKGNAGWLERASLWICFCKHIGKVCLAKGKSAKRWKTCREKWKRSSRVYRRRFQGEACSVCRTGYRELM